MESTVQGAILRNLVESNGSYLYPILTRPNMSHLYDNLRQVVSEIVNRSSSVSHDFEDS